MKQVFRSKFALVLGWLWMAFAAFNAVDLVIRFTGPDSLVAAAVLGVLTLAIYITCLRPALILGEDGVTVRNPLRTAFLPWTSIDGVRVSHAVLIESGDTTVRCWTPQASARERATAGRRGAPPERRGRFQTEPALSKGEQAALEATAGKTHADWVAEQIGERAEAARRKGDPTPGDVRASWAPDALVATGVTVVLVVAAVIAKL
ncbi:PH domain-containing protein [Sinosporangium album]|uniref:PH domain-containing protein n=1 Tax=Sinosporangium album TaxID=504805 RepID=A0A1G7W6Q1_9ACTN|nr:PH domain-containing protein [Sinosporangium album]SDG67664.1 PH domain-containing protein [Sinosporangium album]